MKYGVCVGPERLYEAAAAGFDYAELGVARLMSLSLEEIESLKNSPIPIETFNSLFPSDLPLIHGEDERIKAYLDEAFRRVSFLGGKLVVFGSGTPRRIPEDVPYVEGFRRLVTVTRFVSDAAKKYGLTIAIEPLRYQESNIINTLNEGAALVAAVDRPNIKLLADSFHVWQTGEPVSHIKVIQAFAHVHMSAIDRGAPVASETTAYQEFVGALKASGYDQRISIECRWDDFEKHAAASLMVLKSL